MMMVDTQKLFSLFDTAAQAHGWASDQGTRAQAQTALANYQRTRGDLEQALDAQAAEIAEARSQIEHLDRQNNALRDALEESQSLFAAMCHEVRPLEEIQDQMIENRAALSGESK